MVDQAAIIQELERRGLGGHPKVKEFRERAQPPAPRSKPVSRSDSSISGSVGYRKLEESYPQTVDDFRQSDVYQKLMSTPMLKNAPMAPFKFDNESLISEVQESLGVSRDQAQQRLYQDWVTSDGARLRGLVQGGTIGLADEAIGVLAGSEERDAYRQDDDYYTKRSPGGFAQGEIAGGVLASMAPAGHLSKTGPMRALASRGSLGRIGAGALTGAGVAGAYGFNTGRGGVDPRLANAYEHAKYGAVFGGVLSSVPEAAFVGGRAIKRGLEPYVNPRSRAAKILAEDVAEGGSNLDDVVGLDGRGGGEMRIADLNERTQRRAGSAARLGGEGASDLKGQMAEREAARAGRMVDTFADSVRTPESIRGENIIPGSREYGQGLETRRSDLSRERGYSREGVRVSDDRMPESSVNPTRTDLPPDPTYADEARILQRQGDELGLSRNARTMEIAADGTEASGALKPIPDDDRLNRYSTGQLKSALRNRGETVDTLYVNDDPTQGILKRGLSKKDLRARLRRLREADDASGGVPRSNAQAVAVERLRSLKTAANDRAQAAIQSGEKGMARAMTRFSERLRMVLADGVRDASGRRVSLIGDEYFKSLTRAIEALEKSSGVKVGSGKSAGSGFFRAKPEELAQFVDDLEKARSKLAADTRLSKSVRNNLLRELDTAFEAYRVGAVRNYLDFLQSNPVSKGARVFNDDNAQMRERLKTLFDDDKDMERFLKSVEDEAAMQFTEREALYGSQTAARTAADAETGVVSGGASPDVLSALRGGVNQLIFDFLRPKLQRLSDRVLNGITRRVADELADMLTSKDFVEIAKELEAARAAGRKPSLGNLPDGVRAAVTRASAERIRNPRGGSSSGTPPTSQPATAPQGSRTNAPSVSSSRDIGSPAQADYPERNAFQRQPVSRQRPSLHTERIERAKTLRDSGASYVEIAERMGVNPPVAWALINREAAQNLRGVDKFSPDQLRDMVNGGLKMAEIVRIVGGKGDVTTRTKRVIKALSELQITPKDVAAKASAARRAAEDVKRLSDDQVEPAATRREAGESYVDIAQDLKARPVDVWRGVREYEYGDVRSPKDITDDDLVDMIEGGLSPKEVAEVMDFKYGDLRGQPAQDLIDRMAAIDEIEFPTAWGPFLRLWRDRNPSEIAAMRARAEELYYNADGSRKSTYEKVAGLLTDETGTRWSAPKVSQLLRGDAKVRFSRAQPGDPAPRSRAGAARPDGSPDPRRGPVTLASDRDQRIRDLVNRTDGDTGERASVVDGLDAYLTAMREDMRQQAQEVIVHPIPSVMRKAIGKMNSGRAALRKEQRRLDEYMRRGRKGSIGDRSQDARARATAKTLEDQIKATDEMIKITRAVIDSKGGAGPTARLERFFKSEGYDTGDELLKFGGGAVPGVTHNEMQKVLAHLGGAEAAAVGQIAEDLSVTLGKDLARSSDRGAMLSADGKFKVYLARAIASPHDAGEEVAHIAYKVELFTPTEESAIMKAAEDWRSKQRVDPLAEYKDLSQQEQSEELFAKFLSRSETRQRATSSVGAAIDKFLGLWDLIRAVFSKKASGKIAARKFQRGQYARKISTAIAASRRLGGSPRANKPIVNASRRLQRAAEEPR